jgi:hypothetical protein
MECLGAVVQALRRVFERGSRGGVTEFVCCATEHANGTRVVVQSAMGKLFDHQQRW